MDFDDRLGYSALLISGRYPQPQMHNKSARELCLFDRRTRKAFVSEADGLVTPKKYPPRRGTGLLSNSGMAPG